MKKILQKINIAIQAILIAPITLPKKALEILRYLAVGLGIIETVIEDEKKKEESEEEESEE